MSTEIEELKKRYERLHLLHQVSKVIHASLDPHEVLELIVREAVRLVRGSSGSVVLMNPTTGFLEIEASHGLPKSAKGLRLRLGQGLTGWVAKEGRSARVGDVRTDPRYIMVEPKVRSELAVPLEVAGEVRGVLNVDSDKTNAFSDEDEQLLADLGLQAAQLIQNTWLYEQLRLKARMFEALVKVGQTLNSTVNLDDALVVITREACQLMEAKMCSVLMLDSTGQWLELRASHGAGQAYLKKPPLSVEESFVGTVVRRKKPMQLENVQMSTRYQNTRVARAEGLVSLLSVPLLFNEQALGSLSVYTGVPHSFSNEEIRVLLALAELSAIAIEKARLYERIIDMEEQLRRNEQLSAIGLLAAEVAHEIRNPLTVMKMLYHSLDLRFPVGDPRNEDVKVMAQKMDHLNRVVEQILHLARNSEPQLGRVNLSQLIDDLGLLIRHKLHQQNIEWVRKMEADLPELQADATQLEQAFLNLVLNAAEAMPEGGKLSIAARVMREPRTAPGPTHVLVEFKDTGHGMTEEQRQRAFTSLLSTTKRTGTGLGLAIVARVVESHGGKIEVKSKVGTGTTVALLLPVANLRAGHI